MERLKDLAQGPFMKKSVSLHSVKETYRLAYSYVVPAVPVTCEKAPNQVSSFLPLCCQSRIGLFCFVRQNRKASGKALQECSCWLGGITKLVSLYLNTAKN